MTTETTNNQNAKAANPAESSVAMPPAIARKIAGLRRKLTGWVLVHGLSRWLLVVLVILTVDVVIDRLFKMDGPQRLIVLMLMLAVVSVSFFWRVIKPILFRIGDDALVFRVEDKHAELNESLISAIQLGRASELGALGVSPELTKKTIEQGIAQAESIDFGDALDASGHRQNWISLVGSTIVLAVLAISISQTQFFATWFNRNILLGDAQWPQLTYLNIVGAEDGVLVLPRGTDRRQLVQITEDSRETDVIVSLEIEGSGSRTIHTMKPTGKLEGRERVFVFNNVSSEFRFRATGGDETTPWIDVKLVEPPSIAQLQISAIYPEYTGEPLTPLVGSGPHKLLVGSRLQIEVIANKPLKNCELRRGDQRTPFQPSGENESDFRLVYPGPNAERLSGGEFEISLEDLSGLKNSRPSKFLITLGEDKPPKVRANLLGISGLVVPDAMLPVSYTAKDEFRITGIDFDCGWKSSEGEEFDGTRRIGFGELPFPSSGSAREVEDVEVLDLRDLKLTPGTSFRFSLAAIDNRPDEPGVGKSQEFLLRIVTEEELRADLLRREIEQRKSFEQAYNSQMELMTELQVLAATPRPVDMDASQFTTERDARLIDLTRDQKAIGASLDRIAKRFEEFLVEVQNNRLDEREKELNISQRIDVRFDRDIIRPIRALDQELVALSARQFDNCRRSVANQAELDEAVAVGARIQQDILREMKRILDSMNNSGNFQEVVNILLEIKGGEEKIKSEAEKQAKPEDIFDDDDGIFDNDQ